MAENNYNTQGRELDWDSEIEQESSFVLLPDGDYRFTIEKFDRARHSGSDKIPACPKAIVTFCITRQDGEKVKLLENFFLHTSMEWKLSELFASIGMKQKGERARMAWNEIYGKSGVCHVKVRTYKKNDGSEGKANQIDKLYAPWEKQSQQFTSPPPAAGTAQNTYGDFSQSYTTPIANPQPQQPWQNSGY